MVPGPPFCFPGGAWILTNVGGTFGHHVLVVVDAGIWDSGLGLIRRDHKEFLREGENGKQREMQRVVREAPGSMGLGTPLLPRELSGPEQGPAGWVSVNTSCKDDPVISFATCSSRMAPIHPLGLTSDVPFPQKVFCDPSGWGRCFLWTLHPWP